MSSGYGSDPYPEHLIQTEQKKRKEKKLIETSCGENALCIFRGGSSRAGRRLFCRASPSLLRRHFLVRVMGNGVWCWCTVFVLLDCRFLGPATVRSDTTAFVLLGSWYVERMLGVSLDIVCSDHVQRSRYETLLRPLKPQKASRLVPSRAHWTNHLLMSGSEKCDALYFWLHIPLRPELRHSVHKRMDVGG